MDKQYSVEFFSCFIDTVQKLCRDYLNFEQAVELSGYLCLEIDNSKKERYVLSELVQSSGDVISESYCTKAFKTVRKGPTINVGYRGTENIDPPSRQYRERGQRESTNSLYQRGQSNTVSKTSSGHSYFANTRDRRSPPSQFSGGGREARGGRNEKSQEMPASSFLNRSSTSYSRTEASSSGMINVQDSEPRTLKRTAPFPEDTPSSKKDKVHTGSSSGSDARGTPISPRESFEKESIRLPVAVTVKQENDVPFMVIDNPEDDIPEDHPHDNSGRSVDGRGNTHGNSQGTTDRAVLTRQIQEKERYMTHNMEHNRNETFSNIQRMLKAQQENMMRIQSAPSMPFMRTMSPMSQTYSCEKCGYVSKWKSNLTRHMRLKHGEIKDEHTVGYPYNQVLYPQNVYSSSAMSNFAVGQSPTQQQLNAMLPSAEPPSDDNPNHNYETESLKDEPEEEMSPKYRSEVPDYGQSFSKTHLQEHTNGHYKCENCGESFETQLDLKTHSTACDPDPTTCDSNSLTFDSNPSACATNFDSQTETMPESDQTENDQGLSLNDSSVSNVDQNDMVSFEPQQTKTETNQGESFNVCSN